MRYLRDPNVIAWVLVAANGVCEACDKSAPFTSMDDEPFLEVHHVRPLGEGGPDVVENAVAACPNWHRRFHFGKDRDVFRTATITKVGRLRDYPKKTDEPSKVGRLVSLAAQIFEKPLKI
jgi:5-methylcytosine-specific restriction protein A